MNPETDKLTRLTMPDGRVVNVHQPGARRPSANWRLNQNAYLKYEAYIEAFVRAWPQESAFTIPRGMSPNTFVTRLRDAVQALTVYGYNANLQQRMGVIREEFTVSLDPDGTRVCIRHKRPLGRPVGRGGEHERPSIHDASKLEPIPVGDALEAAVAKLCADPSLSPLQFVGRAPAQLVEVLEGRHDVAFAYDERSDVTTIMS